MLNPKTPLKRTAIKRRKPRNAPNKAERDYFEKVRSIPCVIRNEECGGNTTVSHRPGAGMSLKAPHDQVAALCCAHHLHGPNSIEHMGIKAWQRKYGEHSEWESKTRTEIEGM